MKLRIRTNSIRYRLTKTDVVNLEQFGYICDEVDFGNRSLKYEIRLKDDAVLNAVFVGDTVTLSMPKTMITAFQNTDKVGFESGAGTLHLLVEKDFTCLDNVAEDQSDNYPNPLAEKLYEQKN